jgi:VCBS repeat-containing protein
VNFTYTVDDGHGGTTTATTTFTVMGTNDTALAEGEPTGIIGGDQSSEISGKLQVDNIDHVQSSFQAEEGLGHYGPLNTDEVDNGKYVLDSGNEDVRDLGSKDDTVDGQQNAMQNAFTVGLSENESLITLGLSTSELPSSTAALSEDGDDLSKTDILANDGTDMFLTSPNSGSDGSAEEIEKSSPDQFIVTNVEIDDIPAMDEQNDSQTEIHEEVSDAGLDVKDCVVCEPDDSPPTTHLDTVT